MNEGMAASSTQPDRPANFFENTETVYQMTTGNLMAFCNRLDELSDRMTGSAETPVDNVKSIERTAPSTYFDRCNVAEGDMKAMMGRLENSIQRLEGLGLI